MLIAKYWSALATRLHTTYYYEVLAESVLGRWESINVVITFLTLITASGSTVAGFAMWQKEGWRTLWAVIAGTAALASVSSASFNIAAQIKEQENMRSAFARLRLQIQDFVDALRLELIADPSVAQSTYQKITDDLQRNETSRRRNILATARLQRTARARVDEMLKEVVIQ